MCTHNCCTCDPSIVWSHSPCSLRSDLYFFGPSGFGLFLFLTTPPPFLRLSSFLLATNHLDMESIDALVQAIQDFKGGLMVVSHDAFFISNTCTELWVVGDGVATRFRGDFKEYKKHALEKTRKRVEDSVKSLSTINN